jgi:hypothetical protein
VKLDEAPAAIFRPAGEQGFGQPAARQPQQSGKLAF